MLEQADDLYWEKLDNAAKIYPSVTNRRNTNTYRISFKLREQVNPEYLQIALDKTLDELPSYRIRMRRGFFWYYFERNPARLLIEEDSDFPCARMDKREDGYLLKIVYLNKMIHLEGYHVLTDGYGAIYFMEVLLLNYFKLLYPNKVIGAQTGVYDDFTFNEMSADSFLDNYRSDAVKQKKEVQKSYKIKGTHAKSLEMKVIVGTVSTEKLLTLAKGNGATITSYLTAIYIYSILRENFRHNRSDVPIEISMPVNLRPFFQSGTMRNFFAVISTRVNVYEQEYTLEEIIDFVTKDMKEKLTKEKLTETLNYNVSAQRNIALRTVPLFIKDMALRMIYRYREIATTSTITNLGRVQLPEEIAPYVERVVTHLWTTPGQPKKLSISSYQDELAIAFTSSIQETSIEQRFFKTLVESGVSVKISTNFGEALPEKEERIEEE